MARRRTCKVCGNKFLPYDTIQQWCSLECGVRLAQKRAEAAKVRSNREERVKLKTRRTWLSEAQSVFNRYIMERDKDEPCISCGRYHSGQYHAGHYRTTAAAPELRFSEYNCHKQCAPCNNHKSGNIVDYRIRLKEKIGRDKLAWVEGPHEPQKWTIDDIKEIKYYFKQRLREIEQ